MSGVKIESSPKAGTETHNNGLMVAQAELLHFLSVANQLTQADVASVVLVQNGMSRVIASTNSKTLHASFKWLDDHIPYATDRSHILTTVSDLELMRAIRAILGNFNVGTFVRIPIALQPDYNIVLLQHIPVHFPKPGKNEMTVLQSIAKAAALSSRQLAEEVVGSYSNVRVPECWEEFVEHILANEEIILLLNDSTEVLAASRGMKALAPHSENKSKFFDALSVLNTDSFRILARNALECGVSSPEAEIALRTDQGFKLVSIRINLVRPKDIDADFLEVVVKVIDGVDNLLDNNPNDLLSTSKITNPSEKFLLDTLVAKRSIKSRTTTSFVTIRSWRSSIKSFQIDAMRAIKADPRSTMAIHAGDECASELTSIIGLGAFKFVVPVPCGHSAADCCFATSLARVVGMRLGLPIINAFDHMDQKGSSHPKTNTSRPTMRLIQNVPGPAIVIDDIATSGSHLTEACTILRHAGVHTFAMAWISGIS